jgi:hypothetical protein
MRELDLSAVERYSLGAGDVTFGVDSDRYALLPRPGVIAALARRLLGAGP